MVSPSFPYSCPPPPYSHPQPTANAALPSPRQSSLISPPGSRRTSGDEPPSIQPTRQSLPSIHEALGRSDPELSYPAQASGPPTSVPSFFQPPTATAGPAPHQRSFTSGPPEPHRPLFSQAPAPPPFTMTRQLSSGHHGPQTPTSQQPDPFSRSSYGGQSRPNLPSLNPIRTGNSPQLSRAGPTYPLPPSHQQSPTSYEPSHQSPAATPYGYTQPQFPPPPQYHQYGNQPNAIGPYSGAQPLSAQGYRPPPQSGWHPENDTHVDDRQRAGSAAGAPYGEHIKRHLDSFDLEASLNEVSLITL
jgi:hypothetical protein